jgi:hypothetical protein
VISSSALFNEWIRCPKIYLPLGVCFRVWGDVTQLRDRLRSERGKLDFAVTPGLVDASQKRNCLTDPELFLP